MKKTVIIILVSLIVLIICVLIGGIFGGMQTAPKKDPFASDATYSRKDKGPYGSYVAYQTLSHLFSQKPATVTKSFAHTFSKSMDGKTLNNLYIIVTRQLHTSQQDVDAMYQYVANGNKLYVVAEATDSLFEAAFNFFPTIPVRKDQLRQAPASLGTVSQSFTNPHLAPDTLFSARGYSIGNSLDRTDTATTTILGTNAAHEPNFFRITVGNGQLFVLLNPMTWSNNFLLEKLNIKALEHQAAYLPQFPDNVYWDEYYKLLTARRSGDFSSWQVLSRYPAFRWALWLAVILLLLFALFESKRRQRMVPVVKPLANSSLDFVDTLGKLYYQHHNNANLVHKMSQHLLEFIRTHYFINTGRLDQEFITLLSRKSGHPAEQVEALIAQVVALRAATAVSDEQLQDYYNNIYQFYLKTK